MSHVDSILDYTLEMHHSKSVLGACAPSIVTRNLHQKAMLCSTAQHSTAHHSTAQHSTALHGIGSDLGLPCILAALQESKSETCCSAEWHDAYPVSCWVLQNLVHLGC